MPRNIYFGKTIQHLATRVKEHGTSPSAVQNHLSSCEPCKSNFSCNSFSAIDSGKNDRDLICIKYFLVIGQLCRSMHEEQSKGFVGIISVGACLCLQMFGSKSVQYLKTVHIFINFYLLPVFTSRLFLKNGGRYCFGFRHRIRCLRGCFALYLGCY